MSIASTVFNPVFWFQPFFYALHGWLATEMAIWMLFHPYNPVFIPGTRIQLPLTPGIFPRGRHQLSQAIASTVTNTLLTEEDIHKQTEKLLTEENIIRCIEGVLVSIERELQNKEQVRHIYRYGDEVLPAMIEKFAGHLIDAVEKERPTGRGPIREFVSGLIGQTLPNIRIPHDKAVFMVDVVFNTLLTPASVREILIDGLNEETMPIIEEGVCQQVGGWRGLFLRLFGLEKTLNQFRANLIDDPERSEEQILEFMDRLEVREELAHRISSFRFESLPEETQSAVQVYLSGLLTDSMIENREVLTTLVADWSREGGRMIIKQILQLNVRTWINEQHPELKTEMARFIKRYLNRELEAVVRQVLPALDIGQMIREKLDQFSVRQLEQMIYDVCRRELRWLAFLGAFLGFWLGLVSNLVVFWLPRP